MSRRVRSLAAAAVLGSTVSWSLTNVGAAAEPVAAHYGVSLPSVGLFTTALFVAQLLLQIPGGLLVDRFGAMRVGAACLLFTAAANLVTLLTASMALALALRFVVGACVGTGFIAGSTYVRTIGGSALAQGFYGGISLAGAGLAITLVPGLAQTVGWRASFLSAFWVAMGGLLLVVLLVPRERRERRKARSPSRAEHSILLDTRILRFGIPQAATFGMSIVLGNWVVPMLDRHGDYDPRAAGAIGGLVLIGGIIGRPVGGLLAARRASASRRLVGLSMLAGAVATVALAAARPLPLAAAGALLIGVAAGLPFGSLFNATARLRPDAPGAALAVMNFPALIFLIVGTPLVGLSFSGPTEGRLGFIALAVLWVAAALVLPPRRLFSGSQPPPGRSDQDV